MVPLLMTLNDPTPISGSPYSLKANISQTVHATADNLTSCGFLSDGWGFFLHWPGPLWCKSTQVLLTPLTSVNVGWSRQCHIQWMSAYWLCFRVVVCQHFILPVMMQLTGCNKWQWKHLHKEIWQMQTQYSVATNHQTKSTKLGC